MFEIESLAPYKENLLWIKNHEDFDEHIHKLEKYDIVTANILADVLTALTPEIVKHMKHGALYISSGILDVKEKDVTDACRAQGLEIVEITRQGEWVSVTARRN